MIEQQNDQLKEEGCLYCGKDLSEYWYKDMFGYYFCHGCYFGEAPEANPAEEE